MADSSVPVTPGAGANIDTFTQASGDHRQAVVIGDAAAANTAAVDTLGRVSVLENNPDSTATGTITATDAVVGAPAGTGALLSGASTAGSYVALACPGGDSAWNVQITGLTSGTLYFETSLDSTNGVNGSWINVNGRQTGVVNTILSGSATTNGAWRGNTSGAAYFRVRSVGALTGTPTITIRHSGGVGAVFLNASIPAGTNSIGTVNIGTSGSTVAAVSQAVTTTATAAATGTASTSAMAVAFVGNSGNATVALYGGTYTALTLVFEACPEPTGTYWFPIDAARPDGSGVDVTASFTAAGVRAWNVMAPGYQYVRARVSAITQTVAPTLYIVQGSFLYDPSPTTPPIDGQKLTYSSTLNNTNIASAVTASVPLWELVNAGTFTMRVTRLFWQITLATAGTVPLVQLNKRSVASTGGTAVTQTVVSHDSNSAASAVTSKLYTAIPTVAGSLLGVPRSARVFGIATTLTAQPNGFEWTFGNRPGQAIVLRPGQSLSLLGQAAFGTAPTLTGDVEWSEE